MKIKLPFNRFLVITSQKKRYEILPIDSVELYREKIKKHSEALLEIRKEIEEKGEFADLNKIVSLCNQE